MTRMLPRLSVCLAAIVGSMALPLASAAQNIFAPVVQVNEDVVTAFEVEQRQAFLSLISPGSATEETALSELIDDTLRRQELGNVGLVVAEEDIQAGMAEFASRGGLETAEMLQVLQSRGIAEETFREFVAVGIGWRDLIRARFGNRVSITEADIDRAIAATSQGGSLRVLLSEIIMPAPPQQQAAVLARAQRISETTSTAAFSAAARQYSATASRNRGGRLNWTPITALPPQLRPLLLSLSVGEVTDPIPIPNAVALFQLRGIEETDRTEPEYSAIEFARYYIPGGRTEAALAEAQRIAQRVDVCDDLYGVALGQPEEVLQRDTLAPADIPQDIALELAKLDTGEISTALVSSDGSSLVLLMMCGRSTAIAEEISRDAVAQQLRQERLSGFAESYLEQLRADARIREK